MYQLLSHVWLFACMDCNQPGSPVHGILQVSILEWVAVPFPTQGLDPGIEPRSPTLQVDSLLSESPGKPQEYSSGKPFPSPGDLLWGLGNYWLRGMDFFCYNENLLKLIVVIDAQLYEYTKSHWIAHFKWVNCCVCVCVLKDLSVCCTENRNGSVKGANLEVRIPRLQIGGSDLSSTNSGYAESNWILDVFWRPTRHPGELGAEWMKKTGVRDDSQFYSEQLEGQNCC